MEKITFTKDSPSAKSVLSRVNRNYSVGEIASITGLTADQVMVYATRKPIRFALFTDANGHERISYESLRAYVADQLKVAQDAAKTLGLESA